MTTTPPAGLKNLTLRLIKEHRVLAEYAEVDANGEKLTKPFLQPIYVRKTDYPNGLPAALNITLMPHE